MHTFNTDKSILCNRKETKKPNSEYEYGVENTGAELNAHQLEGG